MTPHCQKVLDKLAKAKGRGVSFLNFPRGFRLGARIFDLRKSGYAIETITETSGDCHFARYVLKGKAA